ncbi:MAG: hypothetical protein LAP13_14555 [Acidobacteriia bacterium]|nr:hypothetical protein [Terriglobia bacterium]
MKNHLTQRMRSFLGEHPGTGMVFLLLALLSVMHISSRTSTAAADESVVWSIGRPDGSSIEFADGQRDKTTFAIGQSDVKKDFPVRQSGSVNITAGVPSEEKPYTVVFDLPQKAAPAYQLVVDYIFLAGAPPEIRVEVNGRKGIFPILPEPKENIDSDEGNYMLLAKQRLVVPIEGSWVKAKGNRITLVPLGVGEVSYDALSFVERGSDKASGKTSPRLEPTIFFRKAANGTNEVCRLFVPFDKPFKRASAVVTVGREKFAKSFSNPGFDFGVLAEAIEIPAPAGPSKAIVKVFLDGRAQVVTQDFLPARQWKLYICPKVHNDLGYTDIQPHIDELDTRNTDTVLNILPKYPFYRFNFETSWLLENYLKSRPPEYRDPLLEQMRQGRAGVNAFYFHLLTELCSGEELYRSLYFAHRLHREYGVNFNSACLTDVPSQTWFLPSLLADVGIKAFANGSNQTRAPILALTQLNENSPFYWEGLDGERVMTWFSRSYLQLKRLVGGDIQPRASNYEYLRGAVPQFLLKYMREDYPSDAVMVYGGYTDNALIPEKGEGDLIERWNQEYEFPKLIVATDADYFAYVEKQFASRLPVYRGDGGAYWEDGAGSTSRATQLNQRAKEVLPEAEAIASFGSLFDPRNLYPAENFRQVWRDVLFYDEHTWGAHSSITQPDREFVTRQWEIKESYATRANVDARRLRSRNLYRLFQDVAADSDTIFAVNLQPWSRTAPLEVEIDQGKYLVDVADKKAVKLDVISEKEGWQKVRFIAQDVPPMGYKGYALRSLDSPRAAAQTREVSSGAVIENQYYRLEVDPDTGGIKSLYDKSARRQLVDPRAPYKLNQFLYVSGGADSLIIDNIYGRPSADLVIHPVTSARIIENVRTPLGQRLVVEAVGKNTPMLRSEYSLYEGLKRVDILNTLRKEEVREKEAVYFAFPFASGNPNFEYQIQNGWVRPNEDQLPGACREWFTTQNVVHVKDASYSIAWATPDAPLITLTDINRGNWLKHLEIKNGHVFSYVMNNYWFTNYKAAQGGDFAFRYHVTSGSTLSREELSRFDADTRRPPFPFALLSTHVVPVTGKSLSTNKCVNFGFAGGECCNSIPHEIHPAQGGFEPSVCRKL